MGIRGTGAGGFGSRMIETVSVLGGAGFLNPRFLRTLSGEIRRLGTVPATGFSAAAVRLPHATGLIDDRGAVSFGELNRRGNAIANGLRAAGVAPGDSVGLMCRNHRGFVESAIALGKLGVNALLLNTGFAGPQLRDVLAREGATALIYDEEFEALLTGDGGAEKRFVAWHEGKPAAATLDELARTHSADEPPPPPRYGRMTILTSGTTGTPKGAKREAKRTSLDSLVGLFGRMPLRRESTVMVAAPAFHSWGGVHLLLGGLLSCTIVMRRRFDPEGTLAAIAEHRPRTLAVVPVMMQRILALPPEVIRRYDCSSLEVVAASGSALPGELALRWMDTFGDNLYNFYGSTEVAQASIATPDELRAAPGTAGRPPRGTVVRIFDEEGREVPPGVTGRIFVGNDAQFEGYTGGGDKERIQGLMSSGDVGYFDENGLLFVKGRDDEMIISGGENVFPKEVEDLLADHPSVLEAAVVGVPDDEFGQRLKAFVVLRPDQTVTTGELQEYVKQHLARYKVPREIVFIDELPRNTTGKVLKRVLRGDG